MLDMVSPHLLDDEAAIAALLARTRRVAVLGIKTEAQAGQPAFDVPGYLDAAGFEVVPVPVYYPEVTTILGKPVYRRLVDDPGRRSTSSTSSAARRTSRRTSTTSSPSGRARSGSSSASATTPSPGGSRAAGIDVVQDRCLMVDHRRWLATRRS